MLLRFAAILISLVFAITIVAISIFRLSTPNYAFYQPPDLTSESSFTTDVGYYFPSPGIAPDNPLWGFKAIRDKIWLSATFNSQKRSRLLLLFADKRVVMSEELMKKGDYELAVTTAQKAEQYLQDAYDYALKAEGEDENIIDLLVTLAKASLRHRETLEYELTIAPQDAKPELIKIINTSKFVYTECTQKLIQSNVLPPQVQDNLPKN